MDDALTYVPAFIRQNVMANCKRSTKWQMSLSIFNWSLAGLDAQLRPFRPAKDQVNMSI